MSRNAKVLGLALVAVLAMSALVASAASGTAFDAPSGLTRMTASQESKFEHVVTLTGAAVTCENVSFSGEAAGNGLASGAVTPVYTGCLFAGVNAAVDMNGCIYKLFAAGTFDVVCPEGKEITVTVPPSPATTKCTIHFPSQTGLKSVSYTNVGATSPTKEITMNFNVSGIRYSKTEGSGLGKCETADNHTTGTFAGRALATGENLAGTAHTDIIWTV